jgi:hypothetical protein
MANTNLMTALIVGAGAVQNAWAPILSALQPEIDFPLTPDGANCILARVVYMLRWCASLPDAVGKGKLEEYKNSLTHLLQHDLRSDL